LGTRSSPVSSLARRLLLRDAFLVAGAALIVRLGVVGWAANRIPPVADGYYYDVIARRIARGLGYTWAWPDGTVTYAAHYPIGYPAFVGALYHLLSETTWIAMAGNALLGALGVFAIHRIASRGGDRRISLCAAASVAVHPGLVTYTPALMTEGVTAALVSVAMWLGIRASEHPTLLRWSAAGTLVGATTYVRPQSIALAVLIPLALVLVDRRREAMRSALRATAIVTLTSAVCLAPWVTLKIESPVP